MNETFDENVVGDLLYEEKIIQKEVINFPLAHYITLTYFYEDLTQVCLFLPCDCETFTCAITFIFKNVFI